MNSLRTSILGCPVDKLEPEALRGRILEALRGEIPPQRIEGLNVAKVIEVQSDMALRLALDEAELVHIDGVGVAWGARFLGLAMPARHAGIDLMYDILNICAEEGAGVFLLGATPEVLEGARAAFLQRFPSLAVVGYHHGYFRETEAPGVVDLIKASQAAVLLIGMSSPRKELFLHRYWPELGLRIGMGVGGSFDVASGKVHRAPKWVQRIGAEWCFRLVQEPRRLLWRYLNTNCRFGWMCLRAKVKGSYMP